MGLFSSLGKLGKAAVGTALLPVDILRDAADQMVEGDVGARHTRRRSRKIEENLREALDEADE
jgi:hypothetical protein